MFLNKMLFWYVLAFRLCVSPRSIFRIFTTPRMCVDCCCSTWTFFSKNENFFPSSQRLVNTKNRKTLAKSQSVVNQCKNNVCVWMCECACVCVFFFAYVTSCVIPTLFIFLVLFKFTIITLTVSSVSNVKLPSIASHILHISNCLFIVIRFR